MSEQADAKRLEFLVFSDDSTVRQEIITAVGRRPAKGLPYAHWTQAATAAGVRLALADREKAGLPPFDLLIFDAEAKKLGGMGLAHELSLELDARPPVVLLTARPQDNWLSAWAHAQAIVARPLDPMSVQKAVVTALRARAGAVVAAG